MTTTNDVTRLAAEAGFEKNRCYEVILKHSNGSWINCIEQVTRLIALAKAEEREACALICESFRDQEEHVRARRRVEEALMGSDEEAQLNALRHESDVSLYHAGLEKSAAAIRARSKEQA